METPIAVVVPTYRRHGSLANALASIVEQTIEGDEVHVVDQGRPDAREVEPIRESFPKVHYHLVSQPNLPGARNEAPVACSEWAYVHRNRVERLWGRLKEWRAVATRYEDSLLLHGRALPRCQHGLAPT